jgi:Protein of unknown function (DUF3093)
MPAGSDAYRERLAVPPSWWVGAAGLGLVVVVILAVTGLSWLAIVASALVVTTAVGWGLYRYGAEIVVSPAGLGAGRALLPWWACGAVAVVGSERARAAFGVEADARAYLLLRSYCPGAVRVEVDDPDDPTPYWLLSSRQPERLADHIRAHAMRD